MKQRKQPPPKAKSDTARSGKPMPPAGPHAKPELTDYDKTPGTGILPRDQDENVQPTG